MSDSFEVLRQFLDEKMCIPQIYQPLMLKTLLERNGTATERQVAQAYLAHDESQIEYYEHVARIWPLKTLRAHGIVERSGEWYRLVTDVTELSETEKMHLIDMCDDKIKEYEEKRGGETWGHRTAGLGEVSGSERYEVLKRAGFRCELCGVSATERALDVDHILPRKYHPHDAPENLQALCWKCNQNKGARDSTDLRPWKDMYAARNPECPFCTMPDRRIVDTNTLAYVVRDAYPATAMHTLVIPKRHVADFFELTGAENNAVLRLLADAKADIEAKDGTVSGFNVGVNNGAAAGQTVFHVHVHLIPRRSGDVIEPRGGVRSVIPGQASYPPQNHGRA